MAELCLYCRDPHRDHSLLCVVEEPHNILAGRNDEHIPRPLSRAARRHFAAARHWARAVEDQRPDRPRCTRDEIQEIILATNPTVEGEATAVYLSRLLKPLGPR